MNKKLSIIMVALYIFSCIVIPVSAASKLENAKSKQQQVNSKINQLAKEKKALENEIKQKTSDVKKLQADAEKAKNTLQQRSKEISKVKADINLINKEIDAIEKEYEYKTELFKTRMRVMYQNMHKSPLEIFIESKSFSEFFSRIELMSLVEKNDEKLIKEVALGKENTELKKQEKLNQLEKKQKELEQLNAKVSDINASKAEIESDIEEQKSKLKEAEKKEDEMIALSKELEKTIAQLQDKTVKYAGGIMKWPTPGYTGISSPYGYRIHPIYKVKKFHSGIDINAPSGANIVAVNSGKVILAGWNGGYGNCIIIDHGDGIATLYGHQSKLLVSVGDKVNKGDTIGKVGSTGLSTGPHLHFEVRVNGQTQDPLSYFK